MFRPRIRLMNLSRSPFSLKADLPVGVPYRFNSRKKHAHTYSNVESLCFPAVKSQQKKNRFELPRCFQYSLHLITVILTFKSCIFALKLIFVNWIFRHCPFIKVCRQRRKTFLLLYCLFFIFIIIIFLFLSHYLRSAISLPFVIGSLSNLASW